MTPLVGLMKLIEMGMEKGGIRDSMATRAQMEANRDLSLAQNPMMSPAIDSPMNVFNPAAQGAMQSPMQTPSPINAGPDAYDKAMEIVGMFGPGGTLQNPTGGALPREPRALYGPGVPNMGMTAQDFMQRNASQPGLLKMIASMFGG